MNTPTKKQFVVAWIESLRLRTLPLALAVILTGSALAYWQQHFDLNIAILTFVTAAFLQILSNLANDYGDMQKGSDTPDRIGPKRGMQKGIISAKQMKKGLIVVIILTIISGLSLIVVACKDPSNIISFIILGLLSMVAAITYTVGSKPYGYCGLGDLSVLIFFGWLSVGGAYYLQLTHLTWMLFLPATASGLLATAVLNINNLRDIVSDEKNGKATLAVRLGPIKARRYHAMILIIAMLCLAIFVALELKTVVGWLFVLALPFIISHIYYVLKHPEPEMMRPMLGKMVKIALLVNILFSCGVIFS